MHYNDTRRVAIVGGLRIPFARAHSAYADCSNQEMMNHQWLGDNVADPLARIERSISILKDNLHFFTFRTQVARTSGCSGRYRPGGFCLRSVQLT